MSAINIDKAVEHYKEFLGVMNERIEKMGMKGNLPTTVFAKEVCAAFDTEWSVIYNLTKFAVSSTDNLMIKKGPTGGVVYRPIEEVVSETKIEE